MPSSFIQIKNQIAWLCSWSRKKQRDQRKADAAKATPKAMTPSAAYPYYETKPMQFRGVKVRAEPPVHAPSFCCTRTVHVSHINLVTEICMSLRPFLSPKKSMSLISVTDGSMNDSC